MAALAELLVEEWLNRQDFFTVRGARCGNSEIDLLGIHRDRPEGWHVEVQVSLRPVGHLGSKKDSPLRNRISNWVQKKYRSARVEKIRDECWRGRNWK